MSKLTLELAIEKAKESKTSKNFIHNYRSLYAKACKKGWMPILNKYLESNQHKLKNHSFKECLEKAKECKNKTEFHHKHSSFYIVSKRNGWLEKVCSHMVNFNLKNNLKKIKRDVSSYKQGGYWTLERAKKIVKKNKIIYLSDLCKIDKSCYEAIKQKNGLLYWG